MSKKLVILCVGVSLLLCSWGTAENQKDMSDQAMMKAAGMSAITVMTRNLYFGGNVDLVLAASTPEEIPGLVAQVYQQMVATNWPERAAAMAAEIAEFEPHLVGLQETAIIRLQETGDSLMGGTELPTDVVHHFLKSIKSELKKLGLEYKVAVKVKDIDVEMPMYNPESPTQFSDVRLTDFDVILARSDVEISRRKKKNFQAALEVPTAGITVPRGYVAVDATINGRTYRFVNTHLEPVWMPELVPLQMAQTMELMADLAMETIPVIVVGDFNSPARKGDSYQYITSMGFVDAWSMNLLKPFLSYNKKGYTSPHHELLRNETVDLTQRIDIIFYRSNMSYNGWECNGPAIAWVVGDELEDRTASGLWPSDHAGVVAHIWFPK